MNLPDTMCQVLFYLNGDFSQPESFSMLMASVPRENDTITLKASLSSDPRKYRVSGPADIQIVQETGLLTRYRIPVEAL